MSAQVLMILLNELGKSILSLFISEQFISFSQQVY